MPKRSASSITITVAFVTSTPTSMTVVATSTCSSPRRKAAIVTSFSFGASCPCSSPTQRPASSPEESRAYSSTADFGGGLGVSPAPRPRPTMGNIEMRTYPARHKLELGVLGLSHLQQGFRLLVLGLPPPTSGQMT